MTTRQRLLVLPLVACSVFLPACGGDLEQQSDTETSGELASLPAMTVGMTAYNLGYADPPGRSYTDVIDWNAARGVNLLRVDAMEPHGKLMTAAGFDRLEKLVADAHAHGMTVAIGTGILSDLAASSRAQFDAAVASRFCNDTRVFFEGDWEGACYECETKNSCSQSFSAFIAANSELVKAFTSRGCATPNVAVHLMRNNNYAGTGSDYHASNACKENFAKMSTINMRGLHEAGKLEGHGVSEPGPAHPLVMEVLYEDDAGGLAGQNLDAALWRSEGIDTDLTHHVDYYYRWYAAGVFLSGGAGLVYGMAGPSSLGSQRYAWGLPDGGPFAGLTAALGVKTYLAHAGYNPFRAAPNDGIVNNGFAGGIKCAKAATIGSTTFIYNPRHAALKIANQQGKVVELHDPASGKTYSSYATIDSNQFVLNPPSEATFGDYFLVLRPKGAKPAVTLKVTGTPGKGAYAVEAVTSGGGVEQVDFTVDGAAFHGERIPHYCLFGGDAACLTGTLGRGKHKISATATGAAGSASATVTVTE